MNIAFLIFIALAFVFVFVFRKMRLGILLAFLGLGMLIGPHGLQLFTVNNIWEFLGQIGITFLWFMIGLELNTKRLWQMRKSIFGFGAAQVLIVAAMLLPVLFFITSWPLAVLIMIVMMLAMSSTASDLQILADRNELHTNMGRNTFSILLFQDLLSIPLLAMIPIFAGRSFNLGAEIIDVSVMTIGLILGVVIIGRFILNPLMRQVARLKSKEASLLAIILNIIFWVVVFEFIGLPSAMGAFLAGMLLSETIYRHQVTADIAPYQILFLSFFFIALGMGLDLALLMNNWFIVLAGVVGLVFIKLVAIFIVARVRKIPRGEAVLMAIILAQGGEFGLLVLQTMKITGMDAITFVDTEILISIIALSMMVTPILLFGYDKMTSSGKFLGLKYVKTLDEKTKVKRPTVIICGFGRVGQTIVEMLVLENISYVAIDHNADQVISGRTAGFNVIYGDTSSEAILKEAGLAPRNTKAVVVALDNSAIAKRTIRGIYAVMPRAKIYARARDLHETNLLHAQGVKMAMPETVESSFILGRQVLENIGVKGHKIDKLIEEFRKNNYMRMKGIIDRNE